LHGKNTTGLFRPVTTDNQGGSLVSHTGGVALLADHETGGA